MDGRLADAYFPPDPPMMKRLRLAHSALWLALLALPAARAGADAIVWSRAMLAPTIAEYYVEPGRLRVDLEIGVEDVDAFRNLMPDEIYERLGHPPEPFTERLKRFYANDFAIAPEGGAPLPGRILEMGPRERARRDEITGEPLPREEGEDAETVVFARIEYELPERPAALTLLGVIFVYPTEGLPERVIMDWDLWNERIQKVPVSAVDQAGPLPSTLEPDWRILEWNNVLKHPELPTLQVLTPPPSALARWVWTLRWVLGVCALALAVVAWRSGRGGERGRLAPLATAGLVLVVRISEHREHLDR